MKPTVPSVLLLGVAFAAVASLAGAGCYTDRINAAPVARIVVLSGDPEHLHINADVRPIFSATTSSDPDGDTLRYAWALRFCPNPHACVDAGAKLVDGDKFTFDVLRDARHGPLELELVVTDPSGATDRATYPIRLLDSPPELEVVADPANLKNRHGNYTVGRELTVTTTPTDPDDDQPSVTWSIESMPAGAHPEERDLPIVNDKVHPHVLRPDLPGTWILGATADDGFGATATATIELTVEPDLPPCIEARDPDAPIGFPVVVHRAGGARTFRVDSVEDDLDAYPVPAAADDQSGMATFQWSTGPEGAAPEPVLGQVTSAFTLDPAALPLGGRVVVRVDARDRIARTCPPESPTCPASPDDGCFSRYSWTVEVR